MAVRRVVVTPAGRARYLGVLFEHLARQRERFDEWVLLVNTGVPSDIGMCERLAVRNDWIRTKYADIDPSRGCLYNIHKLLNEHCRDEDAVYLRLDDDVVYLAPDFVESMFDFRLANPAYFLTYGNIINNAVLSWVHQKLGNFAYSGQHSGYSCMDAVGWKDPLFACAIHEAFLADPTDPKWSSFDRWVASEYERVSINAVCWFGKDLAACPVGEDEEQWLSVDRPRVLSRPNAACGAAVCVHFAFHPQREYIERETDLLERYARLAGCAPEEVSQPPV